MDDPEKRTSLVGKIVPVIETGLARLLVLFHVSLLIFRGSALGKNIELTLPLSICALLLIPEAIFTYTKTKGAEWKWVCPCVLLFTLSTLPQIWMLELDMMNEKVKFQEENVITAVEVAMEMQRQANVDPELCSLKNLLPEDDPLAEEMQQQTMEHLNAKVVQERNPYVEHVAQKWKSKTTITSDIPVDLSMYNMIDDDIDTSDLSKCWNFGNQSASVILNFNQVLMIRRVVLYTGNLNLDADTFTIIPLETTDSRIIRERDKQLKYAMQAKRKQDGSYVLDLETNIRSTRVFQYLEIVSSPLASASSASYPQSVVCEIDLDYTDNYLSSTGLTEYYQPPIRLIAKSNQNTPVTQLVERLYDQDPNTCSTFTKLKLLVDSISSSHVYKQLHFLNFTLYPDTSSDNNSPGQQLLVESFDGVLRETLLLDRKEHTVELTPEISLGDNVITIQDALGTDAEFTLCEIKLAAAVDDASSSSGRKRRGEPVIRDYMFSFETSASRSRRSADPFEPKSSFMLLDSSAEHKAAITLVIEQLTMVTLLSIRWVLPRPPSMSQEQLAGALAGWMGMMADQLNFLVLLDEEAVFSSKVMTYLILLIFSFSQLQFSLVYSARVPPSPPEQRKTAKNRLFGSFLWTSLCVLALQDIPFIVVRCYSVFGLQVVNHTVAYFIGKNLIVIMLQVYRIMWLLLQDKWKREKAQKLIDMVTFDPPPKVNDLNVKPKETEVPNGNAGKSGEDFKEVPWIDEENDDQDDDYVDPCAVGFSESNVDDDSDVTSKLL